MAVQKLSQRAIVTATQGSANAFVSATLNTNLSPQDSYAWAIQRISYQLYDSTVFSAIAGDADWQVALAKQTKASMPLISDPDILYEDSLAIAFTTSGQMGIPLVSRTDMPPGVILVGGQAYLLFDSSGLGSAASIVMAIDYEVIKLSEVDFLRLLASA